MSKAIFKGAARELFRGTRYVFPGEEVEMSSEELKVRLKTKPGLWEEVKLKVKTSDTKVRVDPTVSKTVGKKVTKV